MTRAAISWCFSQHNEPIWKAYILPITIIHQVFILPTHRGMEVGQWGSNSTPFAQESDVLLTECDFVKLDVSSSSLPSSVQAEAVFGQPTKIAAPKIHLSKKNEYLT